MNKKPEFLAVAVLMVLTIHTVNAATNSSGEQEAFRHDPAALTQKRLAELEEDRYSFVVVGDTAPHPFTRQVLPFIAKLNPDFVIHAGDVFFWKRIEENEPVRRELQTRPWWPAVGNHDADHDSTAKFLTFFSLEKQYYSFTFRNAVFIALPWRSAVPEGWVEEELKKARGADKLIFITRHQPFRDIPGPDASPGYIARGGMSHNGVPFARMLANYGVTATFSGHRHIYYRTVHDRVTYLTVGGGGQDWYRVPADGGFDGDVWYGVDPKSKRERMKYSSPTPAVYVNKNTKVTRKMPLRHFVALVTVDGKKVNLKAFWVDGEVMDEAVLEAPVPAGVRGQTSLSSTEDLSGERVDNDH